MIRNNLFKNYFSLWIENFGVVPWFSFLFFLFLPAFFNLSFLLVLVCCVLDAILLSLFIQLFTSHFRTYFLSFTPLLVKIFITGLLCCEASFAKPQDIFISKGEQYEINTRNLESFSVGNKEVIKYKYLKTKQRIFLRGKSIGFSDLVVQSKNQKPQIYRIYVTSKRQQLKKIEFLKAFKENGLNVKVFGPYYQVSGTIQNLVVLEFYLKAMKSNRKFIVSNVTVSKALQRNLIAKIYQTFTNLRVSHLTCTGEELSVSCDFLASAAPKHLIEYFQTKYGVTFHNLQAEKLDKVYEITTTILKLEGSNLSQSSSGFNKIEASLERLIQERSLELETGPIEVMDTDLDIEIISQVSAKVTLSKKFSLELGQETPILNRGEDFSQTTFKFAGLRFTGKLSPRGQFFELEYSFSLTDGINQNFSGPRSKGHVLLLGEKVYPLLDFNITSQQNQEQAIPYLSKVPILGHLFKSNHRNKKFQKLKMFTQIKEVSN